MTRYFRAWAVFTLLAAFGSTIAPTFADVNPPLPMVVTAPAGGVPSDAIVLFDGHNMDAWTPVDPGSPGWKIEDGAIVVVPGTGNLRTKAAFGDIQLHLEWRTPAQVVGNGQERGNSGVFFMGLYELQVLDSYNNPTYPDGQAGAVYSQHPPLVNASRPPGVWQTYDVVFIAPRFAPNGSLVSPARITAFQNGVLIQNNAIVTGITTKRAPANAYKMHPAKLPLMLQDHTNPVAYRNIWVRELTLP